ncbi:hypothetical protein QJS10_CPA08g00770 [Acorus calamus]|uniref:Uncharacterized protein n=1 Tax=Acorus calamus TaxID=4465 RepID=A0AAV9EDV6_ACOCL|nr:hypothetical protein QJS10_CPA08g00770 [Acorus calamus]
MDNSCDEIKGMLSLYEASYLGFQGEKILDEARAFTTNYLKKYLKQGEIKPTLKEQVVHSLELPRHWRVIRFESYWYIDIYERQGDVNPALLELAKVDFNLVQSTHHTNIQNMSRWWVDLGLAEQLKYTRDRVVEYFFGTIGWLYQPQLSSFREGLTKVNGLITTIDDTYDLYGSMDELVLFTDAVNRWELNAPQNLPEYLKVLISALFKTVEEISHEILNKKGVDISSYLKKGTELKKEDIPNAIQCYMLENGVTKEVAVEHIRGLISESWKKINEECVAQSLFPREFIDACTNTIRLSHCILQYGDGYNSPDKHETTNQIMMFLIKPIPLA